MPHAQVRQPGGPQSWLVSSGTEDYFLGTFYFDKGGEAWACARVGMFSAFVTTCKTCVLTADGKGNEVRVTQGNIAHSLTHWGRCRLLSTTRSLSPPLTLAPPGQYFLPLAGLTTLCPQPHDGAPRGEGPGCQPSPDGTVRFSAYRLHAGVDPLVFEGGLRVTWRNGEPGHGGSEAKAVNASTLALVYEW